MNLKNQHLKIELNLITSDALFPRKQRRSWYARRSRPGHDSRAPLTTRNRPMETSHEYLDVRKNNP